MIVSTTRANTPRSVYFACVSTRLTPPPLHYRGAARIVRSIFDAVTYIHDAGIIHCDLKPENILFKDPSEDADIMVCDFGISKVVDSNTAPLTDVCGTTAVRPDLWNPTAVRPLTPSPTQTNCSTWRLRSSLRVSGRSFTRASDS